METLNLIAQSFGYIMITSAILFVLWLWIITKKAPTYDDYEENRLMGLSDMVEVLEKEKAQWLLDKEALEMEIDKQESERRILEKANEEIGRERDEWKGKEHLVRAKKAELELENSTLRLMKISMQNEIQELMEKSKADGKALTEMADANETLRRRNTQLEAKEKSNSERISEMETLFAELDEMTRKTLLEKPKVSI